MTSNAQPAAHVARLATQFAKKVVVYTNGSADLAQEVADIVKNPKIVLDKRPIQALVPESNATGEPGITLTGSGDGSHSETVSHRFLVHAPDSSPNVSFAKALGLEMSPAGSEVKVTPPFNATNVPGCYAVGDMGSMAKSVILALSSGSLGSVGATMDLF